MNTLDLTTAAGDKQNGADPPGVRAREMIVAAVSEKCLRFEDTLAAMQSFTLSDQGFNEEERRMYSRANREIFHKKKTQILKLVAIEKSLNEYKQDVNPRYLKLVLELKSQIESDFKVAVFELIDLLENYMLNRTYPGDISAIPDYMLLKADIWKFFWEICAEKDKANSLETSESAYLKAIEQSRQLSATHPTRLRAVYSYVTFMDSLSQDKAPNLKRKQALERLARDALHSGVCQIEEIDQMSKHESVQLLQLLKEFVLHKSVMVEEDDSGPNK